MTLLVQKSEANQRLDLFLLSHLKEASRSKIQSWIKLELILVNNASEKPKHTVQEGDSIRILEIKEPEANSLKGEDIPLHILFEDEHLLILNKASGLVVHPAAGNFSGTLVNALIHHCGESILNIGAPERPGIVHRLDKDTSGCMVVAKTPLAYERLVYQFAERLIKKQYLAVTQSTPKEKSGLISNRIGRDPNNRIKMAVVDEKKGKEAITMFKVLGSLKDLSSLVFCDLHTGRTHQIRVHMRHLGSPILGDPIYAKPHQQKHPVSRLLLHAYNLTIKHPLTQEDLAFQSPPPKEFHEWTSLFLPE